MRKPEAADATAPANGADCADDKFTAFEAALQDVVDNQKALWRAAQTHIRGYPPHNATWRRR